MLSAAGSGKVRAVQHFLQVHPESLDSTDEDGCSLSTAAVTSAYCSVTAD